MCKPLVWLAALIAAPEIAAAQDRWTSIMPSFPGGAVIGAAIMLYAGRILNEGREMRDEQELVV
jgi:hypothetical protein